MDSTDDIKSADSVRSSMGVAMGGPSAGSSQRTDGIAVVPGSYDTDYGGASASGLILSTEGLTKAYGRQIAVSKVSLHVPQGSVYGLLGPNGAGKSTILKCLTGMSRPTGGHIQVFGHTWQRRDLYDIGSLIEEPPVYPNLTAPENLRVRTTLLGLPETRIEEVLSTVGLTNVGNKRAGQFSMGMKQRLGIALALLNRPKLLILDEPTNGLDPLGIEELRGMIKGFPAQGMTVIVSSHILSEVAQMADYVGIIAAGRLAYENRLDRKTDLEQLFMDALRKEGVR